MVSAVLVWPGTMVHAKVDAPEQASETPPPQKSETANDTSPDVPAPAEQPTDEGDKVEAAARRHIALLTKLHAATRSKLELRGDQEEAIDRLFEDYIQSLREAQRGQRPFGVDRDDAEELRALREKLMAAREAGDMEAVQELRDQFRERIRSRGDFVALNLGQFVGKVNRVLTADQRPVFKKLLRALRLGAEHSAPYDGGLRELWRIVSSNDVDLTTEQRRTVGRIIRDGVASVMAARREAEDVAPIAAIVRSRVFDELTSDQRKKVEAKLEDEEEQDPRPAQIKEGEQETPEQPASPPEQGKPDEEGSDVESPAPGDD